METGKAENQARRNEKLSKRNPERIQQQIDELKALKESGGRFTNVEAQSLEALEKDLKAVKKARETLGDQAPSFSRGGPRQGDSGVLGKRRRDADDASSSDSDVPDEVRRIPMPRDTPPPIPKEILDEWWAKRRARRNAAGNNSNKGTNANQEPLGEGRGHGTREQAPVVAEARTVYEAKPMVRNLQKEAVAAFIPAVVRTKIEKSTGKGGLLEPEEMDQLEKEGYVHGATATAPKGTSDERGGTERDQEIGPRAVTMEEVEDQD